VHMIHTIGDSHSMFGWKDIKEFSIKINHIGPKLMHTFSRDREKTVSPFIYQSVSKSDMLVYCFGEIDCRCHIAKHITSDVSYITIIDRLTSLYLDTVQYMSARYLPEGAKSAIYSVVPPIRKLDGVNNTEYPFLGNDLDRLYYHQYMNSRLRSLCRENNIIFFDITGKYEDSEGYLIPEKSDRICHINDPQGIIDTIRELTV
jgi:hypothetical protein